MRDLEVPLTPGTAREDALNDCVEAYIVVVQEAGGGKGASGLAESRWRVARSGGGRGPRPTGGRAKDAARTPSAASSSPASVALLSGPRPATACPLRIDGPPAGWHLPGPARAQGARHPILTHLLQPN